ncbi:hypothetical protein HPC49_26690 [Pyxidicoccus fallax]|uniref:Uncharacterized protein n=1 Tax=Pyxidicoccus fallax TaxID=394095 RepID=A0A848LA19_9BACT|nr:hypothetical protein [Pyxidicoccus fallax]NMO15102.1 hypothetical protein [Pyxidicoccus fallax]NPC81793.1 hypothetical protein [Pyxidicoccus fallax]
MSLALLPGCLGEAYMVARAIKRSGNGPFYNQIQGMLDEGEGARRYPGRIPRDLALFTEGDERFKGEARPYATAGGPLLRFDSAPEGRICFRKLQSEDVFDFGPEELARVDRLNRAYDFAVEAHDSLDEPALREREVWPTGSSARQLDSIEVLDVERGTRDNPGRARTKRYVLTELRLCGPRPPAVETGRMLTVSVRPHEGVELSTDPYVLFWVLTDDQGQGEVRGPKQVASNDGH